MANVGSLDRTLRFILGAVLLAGTVSAEACRILRAWGIWKCVIAAVGVVLIGTALFRFCPAYRLLGIRTCAISKS